MDVAKRNETLHKTTYVGGWYVKSANVAFLYIFISIGRAIINIHVVHTRVYIYNIYLLLVNFLLHVVSFSLNDW